MKSFLSKTNYMLGLQCPRLLWIKVHQPEKLPEPDATAQFRFDQGHLVGELAKKWFPSGVDIPQDDFKKNIEETKLLIKKRKALFEAGISSNNLYSRADILAPAGKDEWDIIEVKSTGKVKEEHYYDVAFQKYVYSDFGLKIRKCFLMHLDTEYVKKGKINPKKLFVKEDITKEVNDMISDVKPNIDKIFNILSLKESPKFQLADLENSFYDNPITDEFYESLPEGSVFELYRGGKKCIDLFGQKICRIVEIPEEYKLTGHQQIQKKCAKTGKPYIDKEGIKEFLETLSYPLYFMDFETFSTAIPLYDGIWPYQQVPFQFSSHIIKKEGAKPKHFYFLASGKDDPRKEFISALKKVIGDEGSVVVYNQSFEEGRLKELAEIYPKEKKWIQNVLDRMADLLIPFRNFYYYNPKQKGSASIKDVMPALVGKGYDDLEIADGGNASLAFLDITFEKIPEKDKERLRKNLEKYCERDTEGMVWIINKLIKIVQ